jgi:hypothetical protein
MGRSPHNDPQRGTAGQGPQRFLGYTAPAVGNIPRLANKPGCRPLPKEPIQEWFEGGKLCKASGSACQTRQHAMEWEALHPLAINPEAFHGPARVVREQCQIVSTLDQRPR